jgi:RNA polymerase primary sigma factor
MNSSILEVQGQGRATREMQGNGIQDRAGETCGECQRLATGVGDGDVEARNQIVQQHLRLVFRVARQYVNRGLTLEDLIGEGNLGLIRAAQEYNPSLGTRFSTYATYWIREAILSALANTAGTIRLPTHISKMLGRWRRIEKDLFRVHGHRPTFEEVASAMGLDRPKQRLMAQVHRVARIQKDEDEDVDGGSRSLLMLEGCGPPEDSLVAEEEQAGVSRRLECLGATERTMVVLRYGLAGEPPMSFEEIGGRLGLTAAVVQRRITWAMQKLGGPRDPLLVRRGSAYGCRVG